MTDSLGLNLFNFLSTENSIESPRLNELVNSLDFHDLIENVLDLDASENFDGLDLESLAISSPCPTNETLDGIELLEKAETLLSSINDLEDIEGLEINEENSQILNLLNQVTETEIQKLERKISIIETPNDESPELEEVIKITEKIEDLEEISKELKNRVNIFSNKLSLENESETTNKKTKTTTLETETKLTTLETETKLLDYQSDTKLINYQLENESDPILKFASEEFSSQVLNTKGKSYSFNSEAITENNLNVFNESKPMPIQDLSMLSSDEKVPLEIKETSSKPKSSKDTAQDIFKSGSLILDGLKLKTLDFIKSKIESSELKEQGIKELKLESTKLLDFKSNNLSSQDSLSLKVNENIKAIFSASKELENSLKVTNNKDLKFELKTEKPNSLNLEKTLNNSKLISDLKDSIIRIKSNKVSLEELSQKLIEDIEPEKELTTITKDIVPTKSNFQAVNAKAESLSIKDLGQILENHSSKVPNNSSMELKFKLNPEKLGTIEITISKENNEIEITLKVHNELALSSVKKELTELSQILRDKGIELKDIKVSQENETEMSDDRSQSKENDAREEQKKRYFNTTPHWLGETVSAEDSSFISRLNGILNK